MTNQPSTLRGLGPVLTPAEGHIRSKCVSARTELFGGTRSGRVCVHLHPRKVEAEPRSGVFLHGGVQRNARRAGNFSHALRHLKRRAASQSRPVHAASIAEACSIRRAN